MDPNGLAASGESVLNPVPDHPSDLKPVEALMTMTTCHPKFTAEHRMVLHAVLDKSASLPNSKNWIASGTMPPAIRGLYGEVKA